MSGAIAVPEFPNVPALPGVPALLRSATSALGSLPALEIADAVDLSSLFGSQWGLYDQGLNPVVTAKSVISMDFRGDYNIPDYPIEMGGFQSYNKVIRPFDIRLTLTRDGSLALRQEFMSDLEAARASVDIFQVVTPEITYPSVNIVHVDYSRMAQKGANMLEVDVWVRQVNIGASTILTNTASSSGADSYNGGTVQAASPSSQTSNAVTSTGIN